MSALNVYNSVKTLVTWKYLLSHYFSKLLVVLNYSNDRDEWHKLACYGASVRDTTGDYVRNDFVTHIIS